MRIERVILRHIRMPLVHFFETSIGRTTERDIILVEVAGEGASGWGEVTAGESPFYNEEWTDSAWLILRDYAIPRVLGRDLASAEDVATLTAQHGARCVHLDHRRYPLDLLRLEDLGGPAAVVPPGPVDLLELGPGSFSLGVHRRLERHRHRR